MRGAKLEGIDEPSYVEGNYEESYGDYTRRVSPEIWRACGELLDMLVGKGGQYTHTNDPAQKAREEFQNFREQCRLGEMSMRQVFRGMLGQKLSRERSLHGQVNGDTLDSIRDIAGYAILWYAYRTSKEYAGD